MRKEQTSPPLKAIEVVRKHEELNEILLKRGVFPLHVNARLSDFKRLPAERPGYISGPVGSGKTYMAVAYLAEAISRAMELPNEQHQATRAVGSIGFVRAVDLMMGLRSSFQNGRGGPEGIIQTFYGYKFLVIDDLGTERDTPLVQEALYAILDFRAGHQLPTLITSNLSLDRIAGQYGDYGERLASRIAGMGPGLAFTGKDRRWQK
jgi:DNA replication protein DnaC